MSGLCKKNQTRSKLLQKAIVPALVLAGWNRSTRLVPSFQQHWRLPNLDGAQGCSGGGGSSFDAGSSQVLASGYGLENISYGGNGLVTIQSLGGGVESVPEPSAFSLFGLGFAVVGTGFAVRRRRSRLATDMSYNCKIRSTSFTNN